MPGSQFTGADQLTCGVVAVTEPCPHPSHGRKGAIKPFLYCKFRRASKGSKTHGSGFDVAIHDVFKRGFLSKRFVPFPFDVFVVRLLLLLSLRLLLIVLLCPEL